MSLSTRRIRTCPIEERFDCGKLGHRQRLCDHRVGTVNVVTKTTLVLAPVSVVTELGHSLSHVYNQKHLCQS